MDAIEILLFNNNVLDKKHSYGIGILNKKGYESDHRYHNVLFVHNSYGLIKDANVTKKGCKHLRKICIS